MNKYKHLIFKVLSRGLQAGEKASKLIVCFIKIICVGIGWEVIIF